MKIKMILKAETRTTKEGKKFLVYQTTNKKNEVVKVKFQQIVRNIPSEQGMYDCYFDSDLANVKTDFWGKMMWIKDTNFSYEKVANAKNSVAEDFEPAEELPY